MESFEESPSVFAVLIPANDSARDSFHQIACKKLEDKEWNPNASRNIKIDKGEAVVSTYSDKSESDGGTGPARKTRPVLKGSYILDFAKAPRLPEKGWIIGGGKYSEGDDPPDILLTEKKKNDRVSSRHASLSHNFTSGALIITASDNNSNVVAINGHEIVNDQCVLHGRTTSLEFGRLKYTLEVRRYDTDEHFRGQLRFYKQRHGLGDDDYPSCLLATPADSDFLTEKYIMKNPVGEGATSVVYGAIERKTGMAVAVKKVKRTERNLQAVRRDIEIANYIGQHRRICHLLDVIDPAASDRHRGYEMFGLDEVLLVYSPLASWTLQKFIDHKIVIDPYVEEQIFWQLLEGLEFLHSIEVMHRDIKPLNMTVVSINPGHIEARLIDFGWATKSLQSIRYKVGTLPYLAPEVLAGWDKRSDSPYDDRADIFAFGLSMYQFLCRQHCFWERIDTDARGDVNGFLLQDIHKHLFESGKNEDISKLISDCLFWHPHNRPSAQKMIKVGGKKPSVRSQDPVTVSSHDKESDQVDGDDGIGKSIGELDISSSPGLTSTCTSVTENSKNSPATPRYAPPPQFLEPTITTSLSGWNFTRVERWDPEQLATFNGNL